jgi:AcrR family transcriptional regulator
MNDDLNLFPVEKKERADAQRNRQLLLETAAALFREQGAAHVTMSAIAEAAGVGKGTLYRHFPDKGALILALLDADMQALQTRVLTGLARPQPVEEKLRWFLEEAARYVIDHLAFLLESADASPETMRLHPAHDWWRMTLYGLLRQIPTCEEPDIAADVLYLMLDVQTIRYQRYARHYTPERIIHGLHYTLARLIR